MTDDEARRPDQRPPSSARLAIPAVAGGPPVIDVDADPVPRAAPNAATAAGVPLVSDTGPRTTEAPAPMATPVPAVPGPFALGCTALIAAVVLTGIVAALTSTAWRELSPAGIALAAVGIAVAGAFAAGCVVGVVRGVRRLRRRP